MTLKNDNRFQNYTQYLTTLHTITFHTALCADIKPKEIFKSAAKRYF